MTQQINLYSPIFRKQTKVFSAATMLQGALLLMFVIGGAYYYIALQTSILEIRAAQSGDALKGELERLKAYSRRESPEERSKALAERRNTLEATLAANKQALAALDSGAVGRAEGYAELLRALARVSVPGVWLTRVQFAEATGEVSLTGRASRAELVAAYLDRLRSEKALRAQAFARLELKRSPAAKGQASHVEFVLSSDEEATEK